MRADLFLYFIRLSADRISKTAAIEMSLRASAHASFYIGVYKRLAVGDLYEAAAISESIAIPPPLQRNDDKLINKTIYNTCKV